MPSERQESGWGGGVKRRIESSHDLIKPITIIFLIISCLFCAGLFMADNGTDAGISGGQYGTAITGSGTEQDPLVFTEELMQTSAKDLMELLIAYFNSPGFGDDTYIEFPYGSTVSIEASRNDRYTMEVIDAGSLSVDLGDSAYYGKISGIATSDFAISLSYVDVGIMDFRNLHFIAVEPVTTLVFESDPVTDGILIPPDHHLVTYYWYGDERTAGAGIPEGTVPEVYRVVVADGSILPDPEGVTSMYVSLKWYSSDGASGTGWGTEVTSSQVVSDMTVYGYGHQGGGNV